MKRMKANSFDAWNKQKQAIDARPPVLVFAQPQDVWFCRLGRNVDVETNGGGENFSRPMVIIKSFNRRMVWAIPLTSKPKSHDFHFRFTDPLGTDVAANVAQLRLISTKRLARKIYRMDEAIFDRIGDLARTFLST
jgi:mRNA-degrading endonuclease toxin of MazEF toxin-antitoxin module